MLGLQKDILLGGIYTPPEGTQYASQYCFADIEYDVVNLNCNKDYHILLSGDLNAHVGKDSDIIEIVTDVDSHPFLSQNFCEVFESETDIVAALENMNISPKRVSQDKSRTNNFGHSLLDFCKSLSLVIMNGRVDADKDIGKITNVKAHTIVDYCISDIELLPFVSNFEIHDFDPCISDLHCRLFMSIARKELSDPGIESTNDVPLPNSCDAGSKPDNPPLSSNIIRWCKNCNLTAQNDIVFNHDDIANLERVFVNDSDNDIDSLYSSLKDIIIKTCANCGFATIVKTNTIPSSSVKKRATPDKTNKAWFNGTCIKAKSDYKKARKLCSTFKRNLASTSSMTDNDVQEQNRLEANVKASSNLYKSVLRKAKKAHSKHISKTIIDSRSKDPKTFWKFINPNKRKKDTPISLESLRNHFSQLSENKDSDNNEDIQRDELETRLLNFQDNDISLSLLNDKFTIDELFKVVKRLKPNKASGEDNVINEAIINTFDVLKSYWVKLFNRILETGDIPSEWLSGLIVPIFKNKGDKNDPSNYRGITLLSCSAKFFTAVLNERLRIFSDTCEVLSKNQAGFRPNHSTVDHIFILKSLTDILRHRKRKLLCAFIDYEKAFDKVWHIGLWTKLLNSGIGGKFLNVIVNMYKGITSSITANGSKSESFAIHQGVRQGENLSPLLFALYVNDLENYLITNGCNPVDMELDLDDRITNYVKLLLILYADDTVIFADNEISLQKALDG